MIRKILNYFIGFFKSIWQLIKRFFTSWKGIVSLIISFILYVGWALAFIIIGFISKNAWYYSTGMAVVAFWAGPFTPMWLLIVVSAMLFQRYIFFDKKAMSIKEIISYYKSELEKEKEKSKIAKEKHFEKLQEKERKKQAKKVEKILKKYRKNKDQLVRKKEVLPDYE